jgi:hypothetical protein
MQWCEFETGTDMFFCILGPDTRSMMCLGQMTALSSMRTLMSKAAAEGSPTSPADATGGDKTGTGNSVETLVSERSNHQNDAEKLGTGADGGQSEEDTKDKVFLTNLQPQI